MSVPSMVHRSGDTLIVRSVVSGNALYGSEVDAEEDELVGAGAGLKGRCFSGNFYDNASVNGKDLPECKVKRNYSCGTCDFFTQNPRHYLYHLRDVHNEKVKIYECPNCLYASKHFQKLLRHTKMVHGTSDMAATQTLAEPTRPTRARKRSMEQQQQHQPPQEDSADEYSGDGMTATDDEKQPPVHKCSMCVFVGKTSAQLTKHERDEHIKTKFFRCNKCTYVTHMKARYTKHVKYHSMPMIKCDMCDFRTPYKWNLDRHCKNHNGRGAFRCSACNFTADIKQSLTVHEMNHHVPPVGQAAGLGVGRRRNKVGASDSTAAEDGIQVPPAEQHEYGDVLLRSTLQKTPPTTTTTAAASSNSNNKVTSRTAASSGHSISFARSREPETDFVHPDDIVHHSNGKVYIKTKCRFCSFKTPWESEMLRHEKQMHSDVILSPPPAKKKVARPVPDLLPIGQSPPAKDQRARAGGEPVMSQMDMKKIIAGSKNSALKDLARLFGSEELMQQSGGSSSSPEQPKSFFDQFKDNLYDSKNLICEHCDFESKCLTMHTMHMKKCRGLAAASVNMVPLHKLSSTRCQYCRQRCKSSKDLLAHLMTCDEAQKVTRIKEEPLMMMEAAAGAHDMYAEDDDMLLDKKPHPMEHKVFVWTKMEEDETNSSLKQYDDSDTDNRSQDNNQLPWDVRTQSPNSESSNSVSNNNNNNNNYDLAQLYTPAASLTPLLQHTPPLVAQTMSAAAAAASTTTTPSGTTDKIPTHGNDISIAQHKRVFKCPHCTFWASTASRFHVHIVGHLNKKPFECSLCAYRSNWRWDITKHIKLKSVRDPAHESAKVLMTDETGRRNYTKYNKYLTEIHVNGGPEAQETSGGMGTRPRDKQKSGSGGERPSTLRPPPQLKPADEYLNRVSASGGGSAGNNSSGHHGSVGGDKKRSSGDGKKTYWQCKKCNFRDLCKDKLLVHVRSHYPQASGGGGNGGSGGGGMSGTSPVSSPGSGGRYSGHASTSSLIGTSEGGSGVGGGTNGGELDSEASVAGGGMARGQAPFRCGHCHQVSNWKHVIQRHCRLKHGGDIKVIVGNKDNKDAFEVVNDDYMMEPVDVVQDGNLKCSHCPFSCNDAEDYQMHLEGHIPTAQAPIKCCYCNYYVAQHEDLYAHLKLHGVNALAIKEERIAQQAPTHEPEQSPSSSSSSSSKRYKCATCPYVTNSKSQFTYHKQFHKPKNGQYNCKECSYNVSKRHLLHQHMKVHGITVSPQKQNGEVLDLEEISDEIEEVHSPTFDWQNLQEIPLVWVSKAGKFSKMYRCRFCPHVNLRKVNIMEHEKMHGNRERNSSRLGSENEHRCPECNYVCNNAGVLSSHNKVHQGLYGVVHGLVDSSKTDEEQIRELGAVPAAVNIAISLDDEIDYETPEIEMLHFCNKCPARFLKENEFSIHAKFHGANLQNRCDFCTYSSQQKAYLQAHSKVHTKEYQDRTRILVEASRINPENPPPVVTQTGDAWIVDDVSSDEEQDNGFGYKQRMNVPLSGTDLFLQKSEAEAHESGYAAAAAAISRNGKVKDKRFKCPKCPSAFEKRDQFKHHISLHGSNQQYTCTICDYSVNSYPSFLQHEKKHTSSIKLEDDIEEVDSAFMPPAKEATPDVKKPYWCSMCPYTNTRRDAVDNHQKRHVKLSGMESNYTCTMCDYSVPQLHFLRDHTKLHFLPNKMHSPDAYLAQSAVEFAIRSDDDSEPTKYSLKNDVESSPLNNNEGEKVFVNTQTGELVESKKDVAADMDTS